MLIGIIILAIIIALGYWYITVYNRLITSRMKVREAFSTMDIYLKKRFDLIPNLVEAIKGYTDYESETLTKVVEMRSKSYSNTQERIENEKEVSSVLSRLLSITETYPELKGDSQFVALQNQLKDIEDDIEKARRYYNGTVSNFNEKVVTIPNNIVAAISGIKEEPFFEVSDESQRETVKVDFSK